VLACLPAQIELDIQLPRHITAVYYLRAALATANRAMKAMAMTTVFIAEFLSQAVGNVLTRR
jgi:hypothetical protein